MARPKKEDPRVRFRTYLAPATVAWLERKALSKGKTSAQIAAMILDGIAAGIVTLRNVTNVELTGGNRGEKVTTPDNSTPKGTIFDYASQSVTTAGGPAPAGGDPDDDIRAQSQVALADHPYAVVCEGELAVPTDPTVCPYLTERARAAWEAMTLRDRLDICAPDPVPESDVWERDEGTEEHFPSGWGVMLDWPHGLVDWKEYIAMGYPEPKSLAEVRHNLDERKRLRSERKGPDFNNPVRPKS